MAVQGSAEQCKLQNSARQYKQYKAVPAVQGSARLLWALHNSASQCRPGVEGVGV
jgi:hypothetical protein